MKNTVWDLVRTVEFHIPTSDDGKQLEIRVELYKRKSSERNSNDYKVRVFRYDLFETKPVLFSDGLEGTIPYCWAIEDNFLSQQVTAGNSDAAALDTFLDLVFERLGLR